MDKLHILKKVHKLLIVLLIAIIVSTPALSAQASAKGITLNKTSVMLKLGGTLQLKASNTGSSVIWSTENKKIATVKNGLVTAKSVGTVKIKAQSGKSSAVCKVTVYKPAKKITLVPGQDIIEEGDTFTVAANISPKDATYRSLTWSVENELYPVVKQVSKNKFLAVNTGTATVVAYQKDTNKKYKLQVEIREALGAFHIEENNKKITSLSTFPGGHLIIQGVKNDSEDYGYNEEPVFKYSVKDAGIASVDKRGQITALKTGTTSVIVTAQNGKSESCTLTVANDTKVLGMETLYADKFFHLVGTGNYGDWSNWSGADNTYIFKLANDRIGVLRHTGSESSQKLELYLYDQNMKYVSGKTIELPYTQWGGIYQGEDGNYYAAVGQKNTEQDNSKTVFTIVKMDADFNELGRCNITGKESSTRIPYDTGSARMTMSGTTLIVHTDRERYTSDDGLNHQSNITFIIDTVAMKQIYVGALFPYNHVSHSFNQFVQMDGNNLIYVDHGDAYPRSVVMQTHYNFSPGGWSDDNKNRPETNELDLLKIKGNIGNNYTGTKVNGFETGASHNLVAGVSIPHESLSNDTFDSCDVQNVYVSLVSKDGRSSDLIWLTDYKEGEKISASNLRMVKISEDEFALVYQIRKGDTYNTGLILIDSNGTVLKKKEYDTFYSCYTQPLYYNGSILWIDSTKYSSNYYWDEDTKYNTEQGQFTRIYLD